MTTRRGQPLEDAEIVALYLRRVVGSSQWEVALQLNVPLSRVAHLEARAIHKLGLQWEDRFDSDRVKAALEPFVVKGSIE